MASRDCLPNEQVYSECYVGAGGKQMSEIVDLVHMLTYKGGYA